MRLAFITYPLIDNLVLIGDYWSGKIMNNKFVMIVRKIADLLKYTKQVAENISFYESLIDFTDESHWYNPFYSTNPITVIWISDANNEDF